MHNLGRQLYCPSEDEIFESRRIHSHYDQFEEHPEEKSKDPKN
jgi:hypothetical protein